MVQNPGSSFHIALVLELSIKMSHCDVKFLSERAAVCNTGKRILAPLCTVHSGDNLPQKNIAPQKLPLA